MSHDKQRHAARAELLRFSTNVVSSYLGNHQTNSSNIPQLIETVYASFTKLNGASGAVSARQSKKAATSVKRSVTPDYLVCLEDGKKLKMLKRHLRTNYGMTPEEYRAKWGLPADYPMVAPNYAAQRSAFAKKIGLGKNRPMAIQ
ncbi:MucR family transcriptional regulator [Aestuariispira insulae]|uniref:MucR family transcriptional regulator n=1 Tax=Aestuariispira insulae TaxID=1461337 RepID=A0A3D9HV66_9PROT|nr:MucR family transcriptional regulator [Aestuariispira insulae]RED53382.1 MucR family transcriptional regulator [Aestuariispira insulae]